MSKLVYLLSNCVFILSLQLISGHHYSNKSVQNTSSDLSEMNFYEDNSYPDLMSNLIASESRKSLSSVQRRPSLISSSGRQSVYKMRQGLRRKRKSNKEDLNRKKGKILRKSYQVNAIRKHLKARENKSDYSRRKRQNVIRKKSKKLVEEIPSSASSLAEEEADFNYGNDDLIEPENLNEANEFTSNNESPPINDLSDRLYRTIEQYPATGYHNHAPNPDSLGYPDEEDYQSPYRRFHCRDAKYPGYYADIRSGCEAFHVCEPSGRHHIFKCPPMTLFNQKLRVCDWWYNVYCIFSGDYYYMNREVYGGEPFHSKMYMMSGEDEVKLWTNEEEKNENEPAYRSGIDLADDGMTSYEYPLATNYEPISYSSTDETNEVISDRVNQDVGENHRKVKRNKQNGQFRKKSKRKVFYE